MFNTIEESTSVEIVEKKSKFIGQLFSVETVQEAEAIIKEVNKKYFDARHHCYAFRVTTPKEKISRSSDDGEPSGTAGAPMLNILTAQNLSNILVVVTRYFGGSLLGTGGLVKAYTAATMEALKQANLVQKEWGQQVRLLVNYSDLEKMKYYMKQNKIALLDLKYGESVEAIVEMTKEKFDKLLTQKENLKFQILGWEMLREKWIVV